MQRNTTRNIRVWLVTVCAIAALAPATPAAAAPGGFDSATGIVLERTGGLTGAAGQTSFAVDRSTVGGKGPLRMAASREFLRLRSSYQPQNSCCDRFSYRVTVSYRGGYRKTVTTVQGARAPRILWDVINEVEQVGVRPFAVAPAAERQRITRPFSQSVSEPVAAL
jgi:hypothetical protein